MEVTYSEFRQNLKHYLDLACEEKQTVLVKRVNTKNAYVISEEKLATMSYGEFVELQRSTRLYKYYELLTSAKEKNNET